MTSIDRIANEFFSRHWQATFGPQPRWSELWPVNGQGPIPQGELQGCYCLYVEENPVYVGLGAARGSGKYVGHGIGKRLYSHVLRINKGKGIVNGKGYYMPRDTWREVTHLRTIGFPEAFGYLAPALELFMIHRAENYLALVNKIKPGRTD